MHATSSSSAFEALVKRRANWLAIAVLIGVFLAAGLLLWSSLAKASETRALQLVASTPAAPITQATGTLPDAPISQSLGETPEGMPDDVYAWLRHLEETEMRARKLMSDQFGQVVGSTLGDLYQGMLDDALEEAFDPEADPAGRRQSEVVQTTVDFRQQWRELGSYFDSHPVPTQCAPIKSVYEQSLREIGATMGEIGEAISGSDPDVSRLLQVYSNHKGSIDNKRGETDDLVGQICNQYRTKKWFDIPPDPLAGSSAFGSSGLGLGGLGGIEDLIQGMGTP